MGETPAIASETESEKSVRDETDDETTVETVDETEETEGDVAEAQVQLTEDDLTNDDGLFDGVEESETAQETGEEPEAESEEDDEANEIADGLEGNAAAMEEAINEGAARLAVVGLTDEDFEDSNLDKESLETEFQETFSAFRLGFFGSQAIDEYVLSPADDEVDPVWGLAGAVLMAGAMSVWMRPDGDEKLGELREKLSDLTGEI